MLLVLLVFFSSAPSQGHPLDISMSSVNSTSPGSLVSESCKDGYNSLTCLKVVAAGIVPALAEPRRFTIWPGLSVVVGGFETGAPPSLNKLDGYLAKGLQSFLASLSLHINILDEKVGHRISSFSRAFIEEEEELAGGRRRRVSNTVMLGGLMSAGTLLALGMAAISAMAGKALLLSLLSMGAMLMNRHNGGGSMSSNHPKTTYEFIHTIPSDDYGHVRHLGDASQDVYKTIETH